MEALVKKGKVKTIGVSNFSKAKLEEIWDAAEIKPAVNQVELHPYFAQQDFVKYCQDKVSRCGPQCGIFVGQFADFSFPTRVLSSRRTARSATTSSACQCMWCSLSLLCMDSRAR